MLTFVEERFARRLAEEMGSLRIEMAGFRNDIVRELATTRTEILKWSFLFWIGQVAAIAGLLAFALKFR